MSTAHPLIKSRILVTGSHGLIGSALVAALKHENFEISTLVRHKPRNVHEIEWQPDQGTCSKEQLEGFEAVIHLAGENLAGYWSEAKLERIRSSRLLGTKLLVETIRQLKSPPKLLLLASAVGYYGEHGEALIDEDTLPTSGSFLSQLCNDWEETALPAVHAGIQVIWMRFGLVLSLKGGLLKALKPAYFFGLGCQLGNGAQYVSWVALDDVVGAMLFILKRAKSAAIPIGPYNFCAPNPVTQLNFHKTLAQLMHRPAWMKVPKVVLQTFLGKMADELMLTSIRATPRKLQNLGYSFHYPELEFALKDIILKSR